MYFYAGNGVSQCSDLTDRCRPGKQGLDCGESKGCIFCTATTPAAVSHPVCYPVVTDVRFTGKTVSGLEADI